MGLPTPKPGTGLMTIAFDLDGTLAEPTWPSPRIGAPITTAIDALIAYRRKGYEVIVFTSRPASHLERIREWLREQALDFDVYDIVTDKPRAAMYVDDRAVAFPEAFELQCSGRDESCEKHPVDPPKRSFEEWVSPTLDFQSSPSRVTVAAQKRRRAPARTHDVSRATWARARARRDVIMTLPTDSQERKNTPIATGVLDYFPDALAEVARVSKIGNDKHNPGEELHWSREKSNDHADCVARHLLERGTIDDDGTRHSAKMAWRALALLQTEIEFDRRRAEVARLSALKKYAPE